MTRRSKWPTWRWVARTVGLGLILYGVTHKDDTALITGAGIAFAPEGTGLGKK